MIASASGSAFEAMGRAAFETARSFCQTDGLAWWGAVAGILYFYEIIMGTAELASGKKSRLLDATYWTRQIFIACFSGVFVAVGVKFAEDIASYSMSGFTEVFKNIALNGFCRAEAIMNAESQFSMAKTLNQAANILSGNMFRDLMTAAVAIALSSFVGVVCILLVLFNINLGVACSAFTCCMGSICLPFGASSSTQDIALGWLKLFVVYCVIFMPMLALALQMAGEMQVASIAHQLITTVQGSGATFTTEEVMLNNLIGPFSMLAFVVAVPMLLSKALK